jgi:hypothetical protein
MVTGRELMQKPFPDFMGLIKDELPEHCFHHPNGPIWPVYLRPQTQEEGHNQYLRG